MGIGLAPNWAFKIIGFTFLWFYLTEIQAPICWLLPLILLTNMVNRIIFEGCRAVGVEIRRKGRTSIVRGDEIICCGGAINSPQLLQLSGIGDPERLEPLGIDMVQSLPMVGENLQDHLEVYIQYGCTQPVSLYPALKLCS